ncbi:hypothetical protein N3K66_005534 [Trichothecium roseum]|uniref:Uncharacterized protein n=1 Tax=Trichothecium roseum TaxID=47278 RepID=A0ACC0UZH2_9HYPO|nr:hypothetical protein N3K66_005534 [Trichothecium roseum]
MSKSLLVALAALAANAAAHGYISTVTLGGVEHEGFSRWNPDPDPAAIGWSFTTEDEGPELDISSPDFVCRRGSKPAGTYGKVAAGSKVDFFWTSDDKVINPNGWAESHRGPVLTYIAPCPGENGGDCSGVDKTTLRWTKIAEEGLVSGPASVEGTWATDKLRENGGVNSATLPAGLAPGRYVLRNELIALHRAHLSEPEFYAQCAGVEVTGSGSDDLSSSDAVVASHLYSTSDKQMFGFDIYNGGTVKEWPIPGPALYSGKKNEAGRRNHAREFHI